MLFGRNIALFCQQRFALCLKGGVVCLQSGKHGGKRIRRCLLHGGGNERIVLAQGLIDSIFHPAA